MADPTRLFLPLHIVAAGATDIGRVRVHNEDAVLLRPDLDLYILADGAGGHNAGNVASAPNATRIARWVAREKVVCRGCIGVPPCGVFWSLPGDVRYQ